MNIHTHTHTLQSPYTPTVQAIIDAPFEPEWFGGAILRPGGDTEGLQLMDTLYYYDGPISFTARDRDNNLYSTVITDEDNDKGTSTYLVVPVTLEDYVGMMGRNMIEVNGAMRRAALSGKPCFLATHNWDDEPQSSTSVRVDAQTASDRIGADTIKSDGAYTIEPDGAYTIEPDGVDTIETAPKQP